MREADNLSTISYRKILQVSGPIIAGSAAQTLLNVTDTAFIGRLGAVPLGAGAVAGLIYLTVIMFAWGLGVGTQIVVAHRFGEGRLRLVGRTVTHAFLFQWAMALVLFGVLMCSKDWLLGRLVNSSAIRAEASSFLSYRFWGLFFAHTNFAFRSFYVGIGRTNIITWTTVVMVVVNAVLDYFLIFGIGIFPEMGLEGAALASVIAEACSTFVFALITLSRLDYSEYRLFSFRILSFSLFRRLSVTAFPVMIQSFLTNFAWLFFFIIVEKLGELEVAASNIVRSIMIIIELPILGFSSATNTFVSYLMGRGQPERVFSLLRRALILCVSIVGGLGLLCLIFRTPLLSIYTNDAMLLEMTSPLVIIVVIATVLLAAANILFSGVTGVGRTGVAFWIDIFAIVGYLGAALLLAFVWKVSLFWIWNVDWFYPLLLAGACLLYFRFGNWRGAKV